MAFDLNKIDKVSMNVNPALPNFWIYKTAVDAIATVVASAYFNQQKNVFGLGDHIYIYATDGFAVATVTSAKGVTPVTTSQLPGVLAAVTLADGKYWLGDGTNTPVAVTMSGAITQTNAGVTSIASSAVTLAKLAAGITPSHVTKYAAQAAWGGGDTSYALTVTGVAATDVVTANIQASTNAVTLQKVTPTTNTITFLFSADPGAGTVLAYHAQRAAA